MALLGRFAGYKPGYAAELAGSLDCLSWAILKAHTDNRAGTVELASADPRDPPAINFHYFEEGSDGAGADLDAVVSGIRFVRRLTRRLKWRGPDRPRGDCPAPSSTPTRSCAPSSATRPGATMPPAAARSARREQGGVLDGDFRVHGVTGLRVVDASVFPRIPGFFIASAVYMVGEKAADVILAENAVQARPPDHPNRTQEENQGHGLHHRAASGDVSSPISTSCSRTAPPGRSPAAKRTARRSWRRAPPTARRSPSSSAPSPGRARSSIPRRACCATASCRSA